MKSLLLALIVSSAFAPAALAAGKPMCGYSVWKGSIQDAKTGAAAADDATVDFERSHYSGHDVSPTGNFMFGGDIINAQCTANMITFKIVNVHPYSNPADCHLTVQDNGTATGGCTDTSASGKAWSGTMYRAGK